MKNYEKVKKEMSTKQIQIQESITWEETISTPQHLS